MLIIFKSSCIIIQCNHICFGITFHMDICTGMYIYILVLHELISIFLFEYSILKYKYSVIDIYL